MNVDKPTVMDFPQKASAIKPDLKVGFVMLPGFTLMPVAGFVESLRFAADKSFRSRQLFCQWSWLSTDLRPIKASCGLEIVPQGTLIDPSKYDYIAVAGGLIDSVTNPDPEILTFLRQAAQEGVPLIGLCSGSFVLAEAGLLNNRRCAVHFTVKNQFTERYPQALPVVDQVHIIDQKIITCPGGTAIDLAAELIGIHCGKARAKKGLDYLLVSDGASGPETVEQTQALASSHENRLVETAINVMHECMSAPFSIKELASHIGCTERQLNRVFCASLNVPPATYWRNMRLDQARHLILNTGHNITQIAYDVGFSDASHFTLWFKKRFGETPCRFRKRRLMVDAA